MYSWDTFLSPKKISGYCYIILLLLIARKLTFEYDQMRPGLLPYNDALLNLASPNVPYKTKKRVLVQEGSGFIEDVLAPVVSSLGFLML
ncbi:unnamed protein product [Porites lobata]|uniref:Uncharacterized protein n=1 Tax=Porites lobata TaxID=104759 RepID=A0ABN8QA87_9CNID|nr:unnamed protein product [Porites lobata]